MCCSSRILIVQGVNDPYRGVAWQHSNGDASGDRGEVLAQPRLRCGSDTRAGKSESPVAKTASLPLAGLCWQLLQPCYQRPYGHAPGLQDDHMHLSIPLPNFRRPRSRSRRLWLGSSVMPRTELSLQGCSPEFRVTTSTPTPSRTSLCISLMPPGASLCQLPTRSRLRRLTRA
jgi:hypothetical protein